MTIIGLVVSAFLFFGGLLLLDWITGERPNSVNGLFSLAIIPLFPVYLQISALIRKFLTLGTQTQRPTLYSYIWALLIYLLVYCEIWFIKS